MEIKVRAVGEAEQKSSQEIEQELLDKHEDKFEDGATKEKVVETKQEKEVIEDKKEEPIPPTLTEEDVIDHLNKRYNKQFKSVDDLFVEREVQEELPEDVAAYLKYKKETGRGIGDYVKLNRNFDELEPDDLLREYLTVTEEGLDSNDINDLMSEFHYDDLDEEADIKKTKLAKKKVIAKAKKYFKKHKEYYKEPLESRSVSNSESDNEELTSYRQYLQDAKKQQEENDTKREWFVKKTDEVFGGEFKGFEFALDDNKVTYSPGDAAEIKKNQSSPMNFIKKFLDEKGLMKDAAGYHRALAIAMNPERFAKFFYEQGKSRATEDVMRKTKNINMSERRAPEVTTTKGGMQVRSLSESSGRGLKIRSLKKK